MESWITIDKDKCNSCGICALRCPRCFLKQGDEIIAQANSDSCNLCGHCVALCPTDAIIHKRMDMANFIPVADTQPFETDAFIQFIRERRSHRYFKDKKVPKHILEKLIDICRYAPTGGNVQTVEIIVVQDPERRQKFSDMTVDFFAEIGAGAEKTLEDMDIKDGTTSPEIETLRVLAQYKSRLHMAREVGFDPIFYKAPAVIIFHSHTQTRTPKDNCVIASTTMGLAARTMGLETTYIGLFEMASKSYQPLVEELNLPPGHEVFSVLIMGYPKLKFLRTTDRKPIKTKWV